MRTFDSGKSDFAEVGPIQVARWEQQYQFGTTLPFGAMWYTVPPGASSVRDCHPEPELSIVVAGTGFVEVASGITEVGVGSAFLLDSEEAHVVHNRTAGHSTDHLQRLLDAAGGTPAAGSSRPGHGAGRCLSIRSAPPNLPTSRCRCS